MQDMIENGNNKNPDRIKEGVKINNCLIKFDGYLQRVLKKPTDENVALYENWVECMGDIQDIIKEDELNDTEVPNNE